MCRSHDSEIYPTNWKYALEYLELAVFERVNFSSALHFLLPALIINSSIQAWTFQISSFVCLKPSLLCCKLHESDWLKSLVLSSTTCSCIFNGPICFLGEPNEFTSLIRCRSVNDSAALIWVIASEPPSVEPGAVDESGYVGSKKDGACRWSQMILGPLWRLDLEPGRNIPFRCCAATPWPRQLSSGSADAKRWRRARLAWGSTPPLFEHARKWLPWPPYS